MISIFQYISSKEHILKPSNLTPRVQPWRDMWGRGAFKVPGLVLCLKLCGMYMNIGFIVTYIDSFYKSSLDDGENVVTSKRNMELSLGENWETSI